MREGVPPTFRNLLLLVRNYGLIVYETSNCQSRDGLWLLSSLVAC